MLGSGLVDRLGAGELVGASVSDGEGDGLAATDDNAAGEAVDGAAAAWLTAGAALQAARTAARATIADARWSTAVRAMGVVGTHNRRLALARPYCPTRTTCRAEWQLAESGPGQPVRWVAPT